MNSILYNVSSPKLGIYLTINPIAFKAGPFFIHWYGIIIALSFLIAFLYVNRKADKFGLNQSDISDFTLISAVCGIIGARIYYVIFYSGDFYKENPMKIFMISEGGIAIYGAVIGGFLGIYLTAKIKRKDIKSVLDVMSLGLIIGQAIGRWGNFVNQEAFGTETNLPWGMMSENTFFKTVHPCFLYESLGCLICFVLLHFYSSKTKFKPGNIFLLYLLLYSALRALIEGLRTDSLIIPGTSVRVSQFLAVLLFITSLILLIIQKHKIKPLRRNRPSA